MAKGKNQDLIPTRPLRPVPPNEHVHHPQLEFHTFVLKGTTECLLVCPCGQRVKLWEKAIPGFHVPEAVPPKP